MEYRIEIEEHGASRVVHTHLKGSMSAKERDVAAAAKIRKMKEGKITKAIWDIREAPLEYRLVGSHLVATHLPELGVTNKVLIAAIYAHNKEQHEHARLAAHNRGIYNSEYFPEIADAIQWLVSKD